jgi:hypothetical protein
MYDMTFQVTTRRDKASNRRRREAKEWRGRFSFSVVFKWVKLRVAEDFEFVKSGYGFFLITNS